MKEWRKQHREADRKKKGEILNEVKELGCLREQIAPFRLSRKVEKKLSRLAASNRSPEIFEPIENPSEKRGLHVPVR